MTLFLNLKKKVYHIHLCVMCYSCAQRSENNLRMLVLYLYIQIPDIKLRSLDLVESASILWCFSAFMEGFFMWKIQIICLCISYYRAMWTAFHFISSEVL